MTKVIGISGVARAGKDTFASILTNQLKAAGKTVDKFAFADALKGDCDKFCIDKLGVSAFTQVPEEKILIRPFLVWYGDAKRKQSNGRYWVDIIAKQVSQSKADYSLITDVRYDFYTRDEISWVKEESHGLVVHVSRWELKIIKDFPASTIEKYFVLPANDHEKENDPKVRAKADCIIEWENVPNLTMEELTQAPSLVGHVKYFIDNHIDL